jgi:hypothetical protein
LSNISCSDNIFVSLPFLAGRNAFATDNINIRRTGNVMGI